MAEKIIILSDNDLDRSTDELHLKSGVTVLVGCNGYGKSTLIRQIKRYCDKEDIPCIGYDNVIDGKYMEERYEDENEEEFFFSSVLASEGEKIVVNMNYTAREIGRYVAENSDSDEIFLLFDALDSGLSIDNIEDIKHDLFNIAINTFNGDMYIIVAANEYEMARGEQCLDCDNFQYMTFDDYMSYHDYILKTKEIKFNRSKYR